jgi:hypothetical protein
MFYGIVNLKLINIGFMIRTYKHIAMKTSFYKLLLWISFLSTNLGFSQVESFNYKKYISGDPSTLFLKIESINRSNGNVSINGNDSKAPSIPFTWIWGDGNINSGWFPQSHSYVDITKNYIVKVVSHYSNGKTDTCETTVNFVKFIINPVSLDPNIEVVIPSQKIIFGTRLYAPPDLIPFNDSFFSEFSRSDVEYILSVCASIDYDFVNNNVFLYANKFEQYMLRDSDYNGAYSLWFTDPVSFGVGDVFMKGDIDFQALFHEMGHNFTLNTPANYYYGGKTDGNANAVYSETMAQIFSHSAGHVLLNNYQFYGLNSDLAVKLKELFIEAVKGLRNSYDNYNINKIFYSWNNPLTQVDETFLTFSTLAYKFIEHAEDSGQGYQIPLKNMMNFLQKFNSDFFSSWDQQNNTLKADTFRATYMITALSTAFHEDLRNEFKSLNFPVNNELFDQIIERSGIQYLTVSTNILNIGASANSTITFDIISNISWNVSSNQTWLVCNVSGGSNNRTITLTSQANPTAIARSAIITVTFNGVNSKTITVTQDPGATSINETDDEIISIYPNPANTIIFIFTNDQKAIISIYDLQGKIIINKPLINKQIDISNLSRGFYILKIDCSNKTIMKKLIKQ